MANLRLSGFFAVVSAWVVEHARRLQRNPIPYLLAVAMAANIGSVATITGNPQNMMIGSFSGIHYRAFAAALAPAALAGMTVLLVILALIYRSEFRKEQVMAAAHPVVSVGRTLLWKSGACGGGHDRVVLRGLASS